MLQIGMFSKLGKTTIKTLRHYDEVGLLKPAYTDAQTGYRYYAPQQLSHLHEIIALRQMGFTIAEILAMQSGRNMDKILQQRKTELEAEQRELSDKLFRLQYLIQQRKEAHMKNYQAVIKKIPDYTVFSYRTTLPNYAALNGLACKLQEILARTNPGVTCVQPDYCFNIYHDGEYRPSNVDVEFCQAVTALGKDAEGIMFKTMPGATVVSTIHKGAYEDLRTAYAFIFEWIDQNGYKAAGHLRESYIQGVWNGLPPAEWLTELQVPVVKK